MIICANCHTGNSDDSKFCLQCGTKLEHKVFCPNCKTELDPNAKFCSQCGTKIGNGAQMNVKDNLFAGQVTGSFNQTTNNTT